MKSELSPGPMTVDFLFNSVGFLTCALPSQRYNLRQINLLQRNHSYTYAATHVASGYVSKVLWFDNPHEKDLLLNLT